MSEAKRTDHVDRLIRSKARLGRHPRGPSAATTTRIRNRSNLWAAPSLSKNSTPSPTNPASPSAAPTTPSASLMEWKKVKFMEHRIGEDFDGLIISVTKFGFFVELTDLFVEGLVPLQTLTDHDDDRYTYHENTRQIIGQRSRKTYSLGDRVRVLVDRIDPVEKKIQFAVVGEKLVGAKRRRS